MEKELILEKLTKDGQHFLSAGGPLRGSQAATSVDDCVIKLPLSVGMLMEMRIASALLNDDVDDIKTLGFDKRCCSTDKTAMYKPLKCYVIEPQMDYSADNNCKQLQQDPSAVDNSTHHQNSEINNTSNSTECNIADNVHDSVKDMNNPVSTATISADNLAKENCDKIANDFIHVKPVLVQPIDDYSDNGDVHAKSQSEFAETIQKDSNDQLVSYEKDSRHTIVSYEKDSGHNLVSYEKDCGHISVNHGKSSNTSRQPLDSYETEESGVYNGLHVHDCDANDVISSDSEQYDDAKYTFQNSHLSAPTQNKDNVCNIIPRRVGENIEYKVDEKQSESETKSPELSSVTVENTTLAKAKQQTPIPRSKEESASPSTDSFAHFSMSYENEGVVRNDIPSDVNLNEDIRMKVPDAVVKSTLYTMLSNAYHKKWQSNFQDYVTKAIKETEKDPNETRLQQCKILQNILSRTQNPCSNVNKDIPHEATSKANKVIYSDVNLQDKKMALDEEKRDDRNSNNLTNDPCYDHKRKQNVKPVLPKVNFSFATNNKLTQISDVPRNTSSSELNASKDYAIINHSNTLNESGSDNRSIDVSIGNDNFNVVTDRCTMFDDYPNRSIDMNIKEMTVQPVATANNKISPKHVGEISCYILNSTDSNNSKHREKAKLFTCNINNDDKIDAASDNTHLKIRSAKLSNMQNEERLVSAEKGRSNRSSTSISDTYSGSFLKEFEDLSRLSCENCDSSEYDQELKQLQLEYEKFEQIYQRLTKFEERKDKEREVILQRKRRATEILCHIRKKIGSFENNIADIDKQLSNCPEDRDKNANGKFQRTESSSREIENNNHRIESDGKDFKHVKNKNYALDLSRHKDTESKNNNGESTISSTVSEEDTNMYKSESPPKGKRCMSPTREHPNISKAEPLKTRKQSPDCIMIEDQYWNKPKKQIPDQVVTNNKSLQSLQVLCNEGITKEADVLPTAGNYQQPVNGGKSSASVVPYVPGKPYGNYQYSENVMASNYPPSKVQRPLMYSEQSIQQHQRMLAMHNTNHMMDVPRFPNFNHTMPPTIPVPHPPFPFKHIDSARFSKSEMCIPNGPLTSGKPHGGNPMKHPYSPPNCFVRSNPNPSEQDISQHSHMYPHYSYLQREVSVHPNQMQHSNTHIKQSLQSNNILDSNYFAQYQKSVHPAYQINSPPPKLMSKEEYYNVNCNKYTEMQRISFQHGNSAPVHEIVPINSSIAQNYEVYNLMNCSMCGTKAIFICAGCRKAPYCSDSCQRRNWNDHKDTCGVRK